MITKSVHIAGSKGECCDVDHICTIKLGIYISQRCQIFDFFSFCSHILRNIHDERLYENSHLPNSNNVLSNSYDNHLNTITDSFGILNPLFEKILSGLENRFIRGKATGMLYYTQN